MRKALLLLTILFSFLVGCTDFEEQIEPTNEPAQTRASLNEAALRASAGIANVNNPYSQANMQKAMNDLAKWQGTRPKILYATHEYVRFLPKDSVELSTLEEKLKLVLFNYPLDRVLTKEEIDFYSNDLINDFCWKYTLVPKRYAYPPDIRREVLQDAYLENGATFPRTAGKPEEDAQPDSDGLNLAEEESGLVTDEELLDDLEAVGSIGATPLGEAQYDLVVEQSMKSVGIVVGGNGPTTTGPPWTPSAEVTCIDDATGERIPLERLKVRVNTFFNVGTGYTNKDGNVTIAKGWGGRFRNPVQYQILFETDKWKILNSWMVQATIEGPKQDRVWSYVVQPSNLEGSAYVAAHRALNYFYHYQTQIHKPYYALSRLIVCMFWNHRCKSYSGCCVPFIGEIPFVPSVFVYGKEFARDIYRERHQILSTTLHELGHASHQNYDLIHYAHIGENIRESYARAVQYYFLREFYPAPAIYEEIKSQYNADEPNYTLIGEGLYHQGITLTQLQQTASNVIEWKEWCNNVIVLGSVPSVVVGFLFAHANEHWNFNFVREAIRINDDENLIHAYVGQPVRFVIQSDLTDFGFRAQSWSVEPNDAVGITESTGGRCVMTFNKTGTYTVSSKIFYQNSTSFFIAEKEVIVRDLPAIQGNPNPRLGVPESFHLDDYSCFENWDFGYLNSNNQFVVTYDDYMYWFGTGTDPDAYNIIAAKPGNYVIRAIIRFTTGVDYVYFPIRVEDEGAPTNPIVDKPTAIYSVIGYRHKTNNSLKFEVSDKKFVKPNYDYIVLDQSFAFRAFNKMPNETHPLRSDMVQIFKHTDYYGGIAYTNSMWILQPGGSLPGLPGGEKEYSFVVFKSRQPGTIPIYTIDVTQKENGLTVFAYRYPSLIRVYGKVETSGSITTTTTNMGIMGYVYPY